MEQPDMTNETSPRRHLPLAPHDFEILLSLSHGPMHGYAAITDIRERTRGDIVLGTSTLYAAVRRLRRAGLIDEDGDRRAASNGPPRRYWRITDLGADVVRLEAERLHRTAQAADELLASLRGQAGK
jgi:DNA-binding PadR family transcriptional regulator